MQIALDDPTIGEESATTAQTIARTVDEVERLRAEFGGLLLGLAQGTPDSEKLLETTAEIRTAQECLEALEEDAQEVAEDVDVGPLLSTSAPSAIRVPRGTEATGEITVRNAGIDR